MAAGGAAPRPVRRRRPPSHGPIWSPAARAAGRVQGVDREARPATVRTGPAFLLRRQRDHHHLLRLHSWVADCGGRRCRPFRMADLLGCLPDHGVGSGHVVAPFVSFQQVPSGGQQPAFGARYSVGGRHAGVAASDHSPHIGVHHPRRRSRNGGNRHPERAQRAPTRFPHVAQYRAAHRSRHALRAGRAGGGSAVAVSGVAGRDPAGNTGGRRCRHGVGGSDHLQCRDVRRGLAR